jgi:3-hydroxyisobutyrate dehydrogenase
MKALNNMLSAAGMLAAAEVLAVGVRFGLKPQVMLDVLNGSTGRNQATEVKFERFVLSRAFDSGFAMKLMVKDLATALDLPGATGGASPILSITRETWQRALADLGEAADHTELARFVEAGSGVQLS